MLQDWAHLLYDSALLIANIHSHKFAQVQLECILVMYIKLCMQGHISRHEEIS